MQRKQATSNADLVTLVRGAVPYRPRMTKAASKEFVASQLGTRVKLADYRATVTPLSTAEREVLIDQAAEMLEKTYTHLSLKRSLHANDPIRSLRLLRLRHEAMSERAFQSALMDVFLGLRDLHTNYILPSSYAQKLAFLPFRVEEFYEPGGAAADPAGQARRYVVSWVSPVNTVGTLKEGVVVTHWNGSPIDLAVARNGEREAGSNADARRAQGIESLTLRWLGVSLPPDEDWVVLTFTDGTTAHEARFDWEVIDLPDKATLLSGLSDGGATGRAALGLDLNRLLLERARKFLFDPQAVSVEREASTRRAAAMAPPRAETSVLPDVFPRFGAVTTPSGTVGYVRVKSFAPTSGDVDGMVAEFGRILQTLPQNGLVLDVRGNGGGYVNIGERILQMLTPRVITPEPFSFLATPLTLAIANEANGLDGWRDTIALGIENGAGFSQGFALTDEARCNDVGQLYQGPVVLVTDALCYSTTDIFSAGFQDHEIGPVLGCHSSTGAGGANVWEHSYLRGLKIAPKNPFVELPQKARMRVAIRRCTRVGARSGMPVEDYGVVSDARYYMTREDAVENNEGLIAAAAGMLAKLPRQTLRLTPVASAPRERLTVEASGVDRIDVFVDGHPALSQAMPGSSLVLTLPSPAAAGSVLVAQGFRGRSLVVSTRWQF